MANKKSAKKRVLQNKKRHAINVARKSAIKTAVKKVVAALNADKKQEEVQVLFNDVQAKYARAKSKGTFHAGTASRKVSRLAQKINQKFATQKAAK
ncbi:MAG: 30S ribosomal protein S20 [Epsilonproteobacteria bacterium]|nr:30S ribosomal protein S20 [Campylobacterota bacterium]|tara:strand:- start:814 stop:1101 length:288 start_codon:yes stop_codon:yes gene_type:complete